MADDVLYRGNILDLVRLEGRWDVVRHAPAVCVLAVRDGALGPEALGVVQHRPAVDAATWEIPAGLIEEDEEPEAAAARELAEETQLAGSLRLITQLYTSPGFTDEKLYLFEATGLRAATGEPDETEELSVRWHGLLSAWQEIRAGRLQSSAATVVALAFALGKRGMLP